MGKLLQKALQKQAGSTGDAIRGVLGTGVPASLLSLFSPAASAAYLKGAGLAKGVGATVGELEGSSQDKAELVDLLRKYEEGKYKSYLPGVGIYRLLARPNLTEKLLEDKNNKDRSTVTSRKAHTLYANALNPLNWLGLPFALIGAGLTKTKKLNEVADVVNDKNYGLKSWLIPGWNVYQNLKALGASDKVSQMDYTEDEVDRLQNTDDTKDVLKRKLREYRAAQTK